MIGNLGKRLCRREAYAARDAYPAENLCAEALAVFDEPVVSAPRSLFPVPLRQQGRIYERLVNGILFDIQRLIAENGDDAARHVAVQLVVRGAEVQLAGFLPVLQLVVRRPHVDAERLELIGARYTASVVVGEYRDGASHEAAVEDALAADEEVVSVDKPDHDDREMGNGERRMVTG